MGRLPPNAYDPSVDVPNRDLAGFTGAGYDIGRNRVMQALWLLVSSTVFMRWWFPARLRVVVLRAFGADIGKRVLVRDRVRIHWPWKLAIGDNSWIGQGAWLLNLEPVRIGKNVCISQEVFLCTGSHDRFSKTFEFDNAPIIVNDGAWIAARVTLLRGITVGARATVAAGVVAYRDVEADALVTGPRPQAIHHQHMLDTPLRGNHDKDFR